MNACGTVAFLQLARRAVEFPACIAALAAGGYHNMWSWLGLGPKPDTACAKATHEAYSYMLYAVYV